MSGLPSFDRLRRMLKIPFWFLLVCLPVVYLSGCGHKGPLYLESDVPEAKPAAAAKTPRAKEEKGRDGSAADTP